MAGLFDFWGDSPNGQADLALAAGLLSGKGSFNQVLGGALMGGQDVYNQGRAAEGQRAAAEMQRRLNEAHMAEYQATAEQRKAMADKAMRQQQPRYSALGNGAFFDVFDGTVHQGPTPPEKPVRPLRELGILEAMGIDPQSPQGQQLLRQSLVRPTPIQYLPGEGGQYYAAPGNTPPGVTPPRPQPTGVIKPPPATPAVKPDVKAQRAYTDNLASLRKIDEAIAAVQSNPGAFGLQNIGGDAINQRLDPRGVDARAKVSNIGSLKRHERTGAAMTAAESPILRPFVPEAIDHPNAVIKKLQNLRREIEITNETLRDAAPVGGEQPAETNLPKRLKFNPATGDFE